MILLIDVGNSNATFGIKRKGKGYFSWRCPTNLVNDYAKFKKVQLSNLRKFGIKAGAIQAVVMCSVVPAIDDRLKRHSRKIFSKCSFFKIGKDIPVLIKNKYRKPAQVGMDRLVNALAVKRYYKTWSEFFRQDHH